MSFFPGTITPGKDKNQKEKENKGLFSKFRRSKKKSEQVMYSLCKYTVSEGNSEREVC